MSVAGIEGVVPVYIYHILVNIVPGQRPNYVRGWFHTKGSTQFERLVKNPYNISAGSVL